MNVFVEIEPRVLVEVSEPVFYARNGRIFRRGSYLPNDVAERLLPILQDDKALGHLAGQLKAAMQTNGLIQ